jgi:hypothetical protein
MATVANHFNLPLQSSPEMLLQYAMEQPEAVTPECFSIVNAMRSPEA